MIVCLLLDLLWKMVHVYSIQDKSNVKQIYRNEGGMGHTGQQLCLTVTGNVWREWVGAKHVVCSGYNTRRDWEGAKHLVFSGYNAHTLFRNLEKGSLM